MSRGGFRKCETFVAALHGARRDTTFLPSQRFRAEKRVAWISLSSSDNEFGGFRRSTLLRSTRRAKDSYRRLTNHLVGSTWKRDWIRRGSVISPRTSDALTLISAESSASPSPSACASPGTPARNSASSSTYRSSGDSMTAKACSLPTRRSTTSPSWCDSDGMRSPQEPRNGSRPSLPMAETRGK